MSVCRGGVVLDSARGNAPNRGQAPTMHSHARDLLRAKDQNRRCDAANVDANGPSACVRAQGSVQVSLPIRGHPTGWTRHGLADGVALGTCEWRTLVEIVRGIVPEPVLPRFEAPHQRVSRIARVFRRVLGRRAVTATDVPALRASPEVEPPSFVREAFDATITARYDRWINPLVNHVVNQPAARRLLEGHWPRDVQTRVALPSIPPRLPQRRA